MQPRAATATSATGVFLNASASAVQYLVMGQVVPDWAGFFGAMGFLSSVLGLSVVGYLIRKLNRVSLVILSMLAMMCCALVMMFTAGVMGVVKAADKGESFGFRDFC